MQKNTVLTTKTTKNNFPWTTVGVRPNKVIPQKMPQLLNFISFGLTFFSNYYQITAFVVHTVLHS